MNNKLIYSITLLITTLTCFSCGDDDDNNSGSTDLIGTWNYSKKTTDIHFVFDYAKEAITLPDGIIPGIGDMTSIPVSTIKETIPGLANKYMGKYFTGVKFISENELEILMTMNEQPKSLKTTYTIQKDIVKISTESEDFKALLGNIPIKSIDLNYTLRNNQLILYINTVYAKTLLSVLPTILGADMPEAERETIKNLVKDISENIKTLEFGTILTQ